MLSGLRLAASHVTVEPMMAFYFVATAIATVTGLNLMLQKACHPGSIRPTVGAVCNDEVLSQQVVTGINAWKPAVQFTLPLLFVVFAGPWSDLHGRRRLPLMVVPILGQAVSDLGCLLNVYFWHWSPVLAALTEAIPPGLTGSRTCLLIGVGCYLADITTPAERTTRMAMTAALFFTGTPVGVLLSGLLLSHFGFYGVYIVCACMNAIALALAVALVKQPALLDTSATEANTSGVVSLVHITNAFRVMFTPQEGFKRAVLWLMVLVSPLTTGALQGEYSVLYFYVRYKFGWDEVKYGYFAAYKLVVIVIGTMISTIVLSRKLGLSDALIGTMASATQIAAALGNTFADQAWELYVYPFIDFLHGTAMAVVKSIASKAVLGNELGQVNSIIGISDSLFPLIVFPLYNKVYSVTFQRLPGAFFLLSVAIGIAGLLIFGTVYCLERINTKKCVDKDITQL